jgi:DNA-binding response OmpR family regulator
MPHRVVIVEDDPETADMLAEMMRLGGYQVIRAPDGFRALATIAEHVPAVVLLDVMLPEFSGLDILKNIRRDPRLACIPVVIVSAKCLPVDVQVGLDAGANSYLTKPVSLEELIRTVSLVIRSSTQPAQDQRVERI